MQVVPFCLDYIGSDHKGFQKKNMVDLRWKVEADLNYGEKQPDITLQ